MKQTIKSNLAAIAAVICITPATLFSQPIAWTTTHPTEINAGGEWEYNPPLIDASPTFDSKMFAFVDNNLVKFGANGEQLISTPVYLGTADKVATPREMAGDLFGNIYVVGDYYSGNQFQHDMVIVKFSNSLVYQWHSTISIGLGTQEYGKNIRYDSAQGYIYVAGTMSSTLVTGNPGIVVRKYEANGTVVWTSYYGDDSPNTDYVNDLEVDGSGNAYICGYTDDPSLDSRFLVAKFGNNSGKLKYAKLYDASPGSIYDTDIAYDLAVNAEGTVYAVGVASKPESVQDQVLIKYKSDGSITWKKFYTSSDAFADYGYFVKIDGDGKIITCGRGAEPGSPGNFKMTLIKYSPSGELKWKKFYKSPYSVSSSSVFNGRTVDPSEMAVNSSGAIYVTGKIHVMDNCVFLSCPVNDYHAFTVNYASDGTLEWEDIMEEAAGSQLVSVPFESTVYAIGYLNVYDYNDIDLFIRKYAPELKTAPGEGDSHLPQSNLAGNEIQLIIYPNPATSWLSVQGNCLHPEISIFNSTGQQVYFNSSGSSIERIDACGWANGIYFVRVKDQLKVAVSKFVIAD